MPKSPKSAPLRNARHEAFAIAISNGAKLADAYKAAGFTAAPHNAKRVAYTLRHRPEVEARVNALLQRRVDSGAQTFARRQKVKGDLLDASIRRLAEIAHTDLRELVAWRDEPEVNAEGEIVGSRQRLVIRPSAEISPAAATLLKGAFTKAGELRIETHDQRAALVDLVKLLKGSDAAPPANVTVNQINVGAAGAVDAVKRIAFLLASATSRQPAAPPPVTIDAKPTDHNS